MNKVYIHSELALTRFSLQNTMPFSILDYPNDDFANELDNCVEAAIENSVPPIQYLR